MVKINQKIINFNIQLPLHKDVEKIKDKSFYNNNYFKLEEYGDWVIFRDNNILLKNYSEEYNNFTYSLGRFIEDEYIAVISWTTDEEIFN